VAAEWVLEYDKAKTEFRLNDKDGCVSDIYDVPSDGVALVKLEADPEDPDDEDIIFLVATYNYVGDDFEPNVVYDLDAVETDVAEGVDLTIDPPDEDEEEE